MNTSEHQAANTITDALAQGDRPGAVAIWLKEQEAKTGRKATKVALYKQARMDKSVYYKWEAGKLLDGSSPGLRIRGILTKS